MIILDRKGSNYLTHSFKKQGKTVYREIYLGKQIPKNIEEIKENFLRKCLQEELFIKLNKIKKNFQKEWKTFPESVKKKNLINLSIDFTYNTNAIEGSTITLNETEEIIKRKISPNKPLNDVQETLNHSKVFFKTLHEKKLTSKLLLEWHKELFEDTKPDIAGKIRNYTVKVGEYRAPDWQDLSKLLKEFFKWLEKNKTMHPVELAARAHYKFEKIHPFGDGNGRTGRLIIAQILKQKKYPLLTIEYKKKKIILQRTKKRRKPFLNLLHKTIHQLSQKISLNYD